MPSARLSLREEDVVRLALEFLHSRELHIAQLSLERETGVINGNYSDDVLFLRQLVLDGQWDDALEFVQPLELLDAFDARRFRFAVLKHKYTELLCIRAEASALGSSVDNAVEEVVKVLGELEKCAPSKEEYSTMCLLLTLPRLTDHLHYKDWNPSNARVQCFREIYSLVADFLPGDRKSSDEEQYPSAKNDRLIQLIIKGILYEFCVNFCQAKATGAPEPQCQEIRLSRLLEGTDGFGESDLSLLSWLQSVPPETFSVPFEQRSLRLDVERLERPSLDTSWTEHILVTPIKPRTFPHSAMPFTRPRSAADAMSRSLMPALEGAMGKRGMGVGQRGMAASAGDVLLADGAAMSRSSFASFHLTGIKSNKLMNTSVDRLFENDQVFLSSSYADFQQLPSIQEQTSTPKIHTNYSSNSASMEDKLSTSSLDNKGRESPASSTTLRSQIESPNIHSLSMDQTFSGELVKEYQRSKQKMQEALAIREKEREEIIRQFNNDNSRTPETRKMPSRVSEEVPTTLESGDKPDDSAADGRPRFTAVASLEDVQAVRCADFHPSGAIYAVGSNSKTLRICAYPKVSDLRENHQTYQPTVLFKRTKHHKGSIYCLAWSPVGDLLATGSNDKTVKLMRFDVDASNVEGDEVELAMHDGTVRDVCFLEDGSNKASLLISGGAGDCKIYVTDCATGTPFQALSGHTGHVLSLYTWGGAMFVSGSHDRTVRFWDLRAKGCVDVVTPTTTSAARHGSPVAALCVDPSGRLLVSGHEDGACVLYDIRGGRGVQCFRPHAADVRSVRFSPSAYYLLSAGYDNKLVLTDLQGDLTLPLPSVVVAQHEDKAISARWHPSEFSFVSTSADKTATLWALPPV